MKNVKKLFLNTLILTGTIFLMRTVGVSFNVYLTNRIGALGIGLFQLIMSVYILAATLASAGIRLATTRLVVDALSRGRRAGVIMRCCMGYSLVMGTAAAFLLYSCAGFISGFWLGNPQTALPLRILSLCLPFIAMSASLCGYFTAVRKAAVHSFVQILEQAAKIIATAAILSAFMRRGVEYACVAIVIGILVSEIVSFSCSALLYLRDSRQHGSGVRPANVLTRLLCIALPDAVSSSVRTSLTTLENLLLPIGFKKSGSSSESALSIYGTIQAMALPILVFPSAILNALSGLLVPELAECYTQNKTKNINYIINRVLHLSLIFSIGVAGIMYGFSNEISMSVYHDTSIAGYLRVLAPVLPVMYLDMVVDGFLKGLNLQLSSMCYNIIDCTMRVVLVYFLIPAYSVNGYILILYLSELLNFYLSFNKLVSLSYLKVRLLRDVFKPLICIGSATIITKMLFAGSGAGIIKIAAAALVYILMLYLLLCIGPEDTKWFKSLIK